MRSQTTIRLQMNLRIKLGVYIWHSLSDTEITRTKSFFSVKQFETHLFCYYAIKEPA